MFKFELISERNARECQERRQKRETERRARICNEKLRTIGVDKEALDLQLQEKKRLEEAAKREEDAYNADVQQYHRAACLIQKRQEKETREAEKARADFWHQNQRPRNHREFDPDGQILQPSLLGDDLESTSRQQRQKEQLRDWLIQQQDEQQELRRQREMDELHYNQSRAEMDHKALELQNFEMQRRKAAIINATNYNLAKFEEKRNQEKARRDEDCAQSGMSAPGHNPCTNKRAPPETLQQVTQFQRGQAEEKKRMELEKKQEMERYDRILLDSARNALLIERQQRRQSKQLRRDLDSINAQLAQTQKPDLKRGHIDESFFSKFNTCSR
ncbi:RIB43A-like with coiled-coils protein 2 [Anableps anableps]